eukprot:2862488-Rhodomonas_salina.1
MTAFHGVRGGGAYSDANKGWSVDCVDPHNLHRRRRVKLSPKCGCKRGTLNGTRKPARLRLAAYLDALANSKQPRPDLIPEGKHRAVEQVDCLGTAPIVTPCTCTLRAPLLVPAPSGVLPAPLCLHLVGLHPEVLVVEVSPGGVRAPASVGARDLHHRSLRLPPRHRHLNACLAVGRVTPAATAAERTIPSSESANRG